MPCSSISHSNSRIYDLFSHAYAVTKDFFENLEWVAGFRETGPGLSGLQRQLLINLHWVKGGSKRIGEGLNGQVRL